jgi:hypothetical protein
MCSKKQEIPNFFALDKNKPYILTKKPQSKSGTSKIFFPKINLAEIELRVLLSVNDRTLIKGPLTDFERTVDSIQIERKISKEQKADETWA